jgi:signal transduction histidine kinase
MKRWWSGVWRDTLFKRLFVLMWAALVASHLLAFGVVMRVSGPPGDRPLGVGPLPLLPSLPPMGLAPLPRDGMPRPDDSYADAHAPPGSPRVHDLNGPAGPGARGGMSAGALWLDYALRFAAIGVAAWFGARWLSAPMRRLAGAAEGLGDALGQGRPLVELDERRGTLEVRQTAQVFNAMAQRLHAQFDAQTLLMAAISHDLRTPLARLRMRLETMEAQAQPQTLRCVADVHEMDTLIGSVLETLRVSHSRAERERVDLGALVQSLVDDLAEAGLPVRSAGEPAGAVVLAQPAALKRVLDNLIGNALRYGGSARVTVGVKTGEVDVSIDDNGPGIAPEQLDAVFQPFFRIESSRNRDTGGAGLGLYIARDLAQREGGRLTLANRVEGGLRARLVMPLA